MAVLLLALQFLTIIPIKVKDVNERKISRCVMFFPIVGLLLGLILVGAVYGLSWLGMGDASLSIFAVVLLAGLTGGIHLDGLADSADAFLSHRDKDDMLRIMRDAHIGVMGVLGLICILLLKIALIYSMGLRIKVISLLLMCLLSRWAMVLVMFLFSYARKEGKALFYIKGASPKVFASSTIATMFLAFAIWRLQGLALMAVITLIVWLIGKAIQKKIQGITGDTIGAINELSEVLVLFAILIIERVWV